MKISKAAVTSKNSYILACRDLGRTKLAERVRSLRKASKNIQLQSGGVLYVKDARVMKQTREAEDAAKKARQEEREQRAQLVEEAIAADPNNDEPYSDIEF